MRFPVFFFFILSACTTHKEGSEIDRLPLYSTDRLVVIPGETLEFDAKAGFVSMGTIFLKVFPGMEEMGGKTCAHIQATATSRSGVSWFSVIRHHWDSWIDTSSGRSVRMVRNVQENKYHSEQELLFFPDSNRIVQTELHKPGRPSRIFPADPLKMSDLVNTIWKFRYTDFDAYPPGDTLRYASFFDGEWLVFEVRYGGIKSLKIKGKRKDCYVLFPVGISSSYLRGRDPAEVWIEKGRLRRPLKIKVSTYFGNLHVDMKNP
jgi:hypothetical protein